MPHYWEKPHLLQKEELQKQLYKQVYQPNYQNVPNVEVKNNSHKLYENLKMNKDENSYEYEKRNTLGLLEHAKQCMDPKCLLLSSLK